MIKICAMCGNNFETNKLNQKVCSAECKRMGNIIRNREYRKRMSNASKKKTTPPKKKAQRTLECYACGKSFERSFANEKFCSDECRLKYFKVNERNGL